MTTGASNDIEQATKLARAMITRYGMSEEFDMVALETVQQPVSGRGRLPGLRGGHGRPSGRPWWWRPVKEAHDKAYAILLGEPRTSSDRLAAYLLEKETITGEEFMNLLQQGKEN